MLRRSGQAVFFFLSLVHGLSLGTVLFANLLAGSSGDDTRFATWETSTGIDLDSLAPETHTMMPPAQGPQQPAMNGSGQPGRARTWRRPQDTRHLSRRRAMVRTQSGYSKVAGLIVLAAAAGVLYSRRAPRDEKRSTSDKQRPSLEEGSSGQQSPSLAKQASFVESQSLLLSQQVLSVAMYAVALYLFKGQVGPTVEQPPPQKTVRVSISGPSLVSLLVALPLAGLPFIAMMIQRRYQEKANEAALETLAEMLHAESLSAEVDELRHWVGEGERNRDGARSPVGKRRRKTDERTRKADEAQRTSWAVDKEDGGLRTMRQPMKAEPQAGDLTGQALQERLRSLYPPEERKAVTDRPEYIGRRRDNSLEERRDLADEALRERLKSLYSPAQR